MSDVWMNVVMLVKTVWLVVILLCVHRCLLVTNRAWRIRLKIAESRGKDAHGKPLPLDRRALIEPLLFWLAALVGSLLVFSLLGELV